MSARQEKEFAIVLRGLKIICDGSAGQDYHALAKRNGIPNAALGAATIISFLLELFGGTFGQVY